MNGTVWCRADLWDQTFHRWPIIVCSLFSGHLPWALGVWFAEVPSPPSRSLTQWKLLWTRERLFIAQDSEGEGERPYMSQIGLWKFSFPCLQAQPHMQVNTAWQVATSQMTLQFPYSKWEINPFILTSGDWELCSHHLALAEEERARGVSMAQLICGNLSSSHKRYHTSASLIPYMKWWQCSSWCQGWWK